jgi:DNA invertase Pin-like site-specific DNA recombinase
VKTTKNSALRVIGYVRVSTDEQGDSGAGLAAQRATIEAECAHRGWVLVEIAEDVASGKSIDRPGLNGALADLDAGKADVLVAAKVDRVSRSVLDFAALLARADHSPWKLVVLDIGADLTTPAGELMAGIIAQIAQYERKLIGQRTKDALAAKKAAGVRLGRPAVLPAEVVDRIVSDYAAGHGISAIARALTAEGVPTARGGASWSPSTVQNVLRRAERAAQPV